MCVNVQGARDHLELLLKMVISQEQMFEAQDEDFASPNEGEKISDSTGSCWYSLSYSLLVVVERGSRRLSCSPPCLP